MHTKILIEIVYFDPKQELCQLLEEKQSEQKEKRSNPVNFDRVTSSTLYFVLN